MKQVIGFLILSAFVFVLIYVASVHEYAEAQPLRPFSVYRSGDYCVFVTYTATDIWADFRPYGRCEGGAK